MNPIKLLILLSFICLAGCAKEEDPQGIIPKHQLQALEKAKAVEQKLHDAEAQLREQVEKQTH